MGDAIGGTEVQETVTEATNNGVLGRTSPIETTIAQAVNSDANQGRFVGLAWYWWLLVLAGVAGIGWWISKAARRAAQRAN
jgi:hypothetical protein